MTRLTLEQVKKAGRFAWHIEAGQALIFVDGEFLRFHEVFGRTMEQKDDELRFWPADYAAPLTDRNRYGWMHLPACDCEFCGGER